MSRTDAKPVRHAQVPSTLGGWLVRLRFAIARRIVQLGVLALFIGTARLGWTVFGKPLLAGDLSNSLIAGTVLLTDPFLFLQKLCAGHPIETKMIAGAALIVAVYLLAGGRAFCAWMCPMNMVTDLADWVRMRLGIRTDWIHVSPKVRYALALGALLGSAISGTAAFEWVSPQAFLWRETVWGIGLGSVSAVLGVFAFDLFAVRRGWCGHLCPLGAFWSVVGDAGVVKPLFAADRCTRCADCLKVCPESQVINFKEMTAKGLIAGGECTNCGRCVAICPEKALSFGLRFAAKKAPDATISKKDTRS